MRHFPGLLTTVLLVVTLGGCNGSSTTAPQPADSGGGYRSVAAGESPSGNKPAAAERGSENGAAGEMPAFYDGQLFTINSVEISDSGSESLIGRNSSLNEIYATNDLDEEQDFIPVIDAIQGDGFNPLWRQVLIVFNDGFTPHQFFSDDEIDEAADGANPEITLVETDEVYRCSVVGSSID